MTATDELRHLLDERGVEWDADDEIMDDGSISQVTYWYSNDIEWSADGRDEYLAFDAVQLITPEQAIAATLGVGACHADETETWQGVCMSNPIRYVRNLTIHVMECNACGGTYEYVNGGYEFCPRCGAKVVVE